MSAYALAHLHNPNINDEVLEYLERIQDTMDPFGGRFLAHGPNVEVLEGDWPGTVVVLEFPDLDAARAWYASEPYQAILRYRTDNIDGTAILFEGVPEGYHPRTKVAALREAATAD